MKNIFYIIKGFFAGFVGVLLGLFIFFVGGGLIFKDFYKPFIILSGSMEPGIHTGSVVISRPTETYKVGEVITFAPNGSKKDLVTHRISEVTKEGFITKGDANEDADSGEVKRENIIGKVEVTIPFLGYLVDFAKTPQGFIIFVIIPATIIVYEELKSITREIFKKKHETLTPTLQHTKQNPKVLTNSSPRWAVIAPLAGVAFVVTFAVSSSYFSDNENNIGNVLGANASFGEKVSNLYNSDPYTCPTGATNTEGTTFGLTVLKKVDTKLKVSVKLVGATPSASYDIWVNQDPGGCPLSEPTAPALITTDTNGDGVASIEVDLVNNAINFWVSAVGGGQVLRGTAVSF